MIETILRDEEIISGPCTGNQDGCMQGLRNLVSDSAEYTDQKCEQEASPQHNGGAPEMATALCQMREAAKTTVRVANFGARMGQHKAD
ncbi:hypothetical protein N9B69_01695 [Amylibacter sp.]|nr:hypothetical protein [Amylibacter sp.]